MKLSKNNGVSLNTIGFIDIIRKLVGLMINNTKQKKMKTIKFFGLILLAVLAFNSCSKDDDEDFMDVTETYWETTQVKTSNNVNSITQTFTGEDLETFYYNQTLQFEADGVFSLYDAYYEGDFVGTWTQNGSKIEVTITINDEETTRSYTISGSTLTQKVVDEMESITATTVFTFSLVTPS